MGNYISQDPIGLSGNNSTLYSYVQDTNNSIDIFGLSKQSNSCERGIKKARKDLKKAGLSFVGEEVTIIVNGARVRADLVYTDGKDLYVVEVKNNTGKLTKNQTAAGVYNQQANKGGTIDMSQTTSGSFEVATDNRTKVGDRGDQKSATFILIKYED